MHPPYWVDLALGEKKQLVRSEPTRRKLVVLIQFSGRCTRAGFY